ncbi:methyltransferase domain-containing protein [Xylariaceae sp. FL0594]|nr:methyltransferase domain-containing protein [Xylariaceae sp. FL0594]
MLPTPDTSHVSYERVYEPAEDSFLLLDTLSSASEAAWLRERFSTTQEEEKHNKISSSPPPLVIEIGPGSGVVIAFATAHARHIFGRGDVVTGAVDVNAHACAATGETVRKALSEQSQAQSQSQSHSQQFIGAVQGDLTSPLRSASVDVLVFNPPYVPTAELPSREEYYGSTTQEEEGGAGAGGGGVKSDRVRENSYAEDSYLLALSYAGGRDGMETTDRLLESLPRVLSPRGCAYVLLCAQNRPEEVKERIRRGGYGFASAPEEKGKGEGGGGRKWNVETVGSSGKKAGWERLQIIRIWRD